MNGADNVAALLANLILLGYGVMVTQLTLTQSFQVRVLVALPNILGIRQVGLRHLILIQAFPGSNPGSSAISVRNSVGLECLSSKQEVGSSNLSGPAKRRTL